MSINYTDSDARFAAMQADIMANTDITDFRDGSVARALVDVFNDEMEEIYITMNRYLSMAFLSTATGSYLDLIGGSKCTRLTNETDDNYRYRIAQTTYTEANANETAIRLKCLTVDEVNDIVIIPHTYGIGSFSALVLTDYTTVPTSIISAVQEVIDNNKAAGIKGVAIAPTVVTIDLNIKLHTDATISASEHSTIIYEASQAINDYIDAIPVGDSFTPAELYSLVYQLSNKINYLEITTMKIDGKLTYNYAYSCSWSQKLAAGSIVVE